MKKVRRVRRFEILKGNENFRKLNELCLLSRNMYNSTLFILRNLQFASFPRNGNKPEYYLSQIYESIRKYVETETKTYKTKEGEEKTVTYYNLVFHSDGNENGKVMDEKALYIILHRTGNKDYESMQCSASRNAVKLAVKSMKSYKKSIVDYLKNKSKYKGEPKLPRYVKGNDVVSFAVDNFKTNKKDNSITINGNCTLENVYVENENETVKQIRVVPRTTMDMFIVEVVYEKNVCDVIPGNGVLGIDIGINNIVAMSDTNGNSMLVNGNALKGINQFYNKKLAELNNLYSNFGSKNKDFSVYSGKKRRMFERKRFNKVRTFMHQTSRYIVDYSVANGIGKIVIGHNDGWKNEANIGKVNNQKFVQIPFNDLISQIKYKAEEYNIDVVEINESYTSKCSALDNEKICKHENYKGRRGGRHNKEYITENGKLINADINGSLNILRLGTGKDISKRTSSILTPPKFNKVGFEKFKMQSQNHSEIQNDMVYEDPEMENCIKIEATVDSHNVEKSMFKNQIHHF